MAHMFVPPLPGLGLFTQRTQGFALG